MCRLLAYQGAPVLLEDLVTAPAHSLVHQSRFAAEAKTVTNEDGFGLGWYGEGSSPVVYRDPGPAWSDDTLGGLCARTRSPLFFAHVRASTGTAKVRANCHPFACGHHLFMHNGQIGGYERIRAEIEALIPPALRAARHGATDSEAIFLAALGAGLADDPIGAMRRTLLAIRGLMDEAGIRQALRVSAAFSDGEGLWAYRWACDGRSPSLYYRAGETGIVIASEPTDERRLGWQPVPKNAVLALRPGARPEIAPLFAECSALAA